MARRVAFTTAEGLARRLPIAAGIDVVRTALRGPEIPSCPSAGSGHWADLAGPTASGVRGTLSVSRSGGNEGALFVLHASDGSVRALIDGVSLRRRAAAAAAAVAVERMARDDARRLAVIGSGDLAVAATEAVLTILPGIAVAVHDPDGPGGIAGRSYLTPADAIRNADVVLVATSSRDPAVRFDWLAEGALVLALGGSRATDRELDGRTLERARFVCCDDLAAAQLRAGDLIEPVALGLLSWLEVHELGEVVRDDLPARAAQTDLVVYKGVGSARLPLALAEALM